jgi:hypothetical protein
MELILLLHKQFSHWFFQEKDVEYLSIIQI